MLPTTYTFSCWLPPSGNLSVRSTVPTSFTGSPAMSMASAERTFDGFLALSHEYNRACLALSSRMWFWPFATRWRYQPDAWWSALQQSLHRGRWRASERLADANASQASREQHAAATGTTSSSSSTSQAPLPYVFGGGFAGRDWDTLSKALHGLPVTLRLYAGGSTSNEGSPACVEAPQLQCMPVVSTGAFEEAMDGALYVAVPLYSWGSLWPKNAKLKANLQAAGARSTGKLVTGLTTVVEGMHRGKVVVATARSPSLFEEYLRDEELLMPAGSVGAWRNVTLRLLERHKRGTLHRLEADAMRHARSLFATEAMARRLARVLE